MRVRDEEHGAVLAIVAISFICLIGMLVLTFDLGRGVALKRNMVNGADSAALAAAMECGMAHGEAAARQEAADLLADNNGAATVTGFQINPSPAQCDGAPNPDPDHNPTVTVTVRVPQQYFFAPIFGINNGTVVATATAEWTTGASNPAPIRLEGVKIDECLAAGTPDAEGRVDCYFTFEPNGGQWGWLNLPEGWPIKGQDSNPLAKCPNTGGTKDLKDYIGAMGGMGTPGGPTLSGSLLWDPTGGGNPPTWVCAANGRIDAARDAIAQWISNVTTLMDQGKLESEPVVLFPIAACTGAPPCYSGPKDAYPVIRLQGFYVKETFKGKQEVTKNCGVKPKSGSVFCLHLQTTGLDDSSTGGRPVVRLVG